MTLQVSAGKDLTIQQRILGALYGQMLGDSLGMPSELWPRSRVRSHFGWIDRFLDGPQENSAACYFSAGQFTDDTSMALALADALLEANGKVVPELIARNVIRWVDSFDAFNKNILGPSSKVALREQKEGKPISSLENNGVTNGAAMRVSPLGCVLPSAPLRTFVDQVWERRAQRISLILLSRGQSSLRGQYLKRLRAQAGPKLKRLCLPLPPMHKNSVHPLSARRWQRVSNSRFPWLPMRMVLKMPASVSISWSEPV